MDSLLRLGLLHTDGDNAKLPGADVRAPSNEVPRLNTCRSQRPARPIEWAIYLWAIYLCAIYLWAIYLWAIYLWAIYLWAIYLGSTTCALGTSFLIMSTAFWQADLSLYPLLDAATSWPFDARSRHRYPMAR